MRCAADLRLLSALFLDLLNQSTNDPTVYLRRLAGAAAGDLLDLDFLVQAPPCLGQSELRRLLPPLEKAYALGREERDGLSIPANEPGTVPGVDLDVREHTDVRLDEHGSSEGEREEAYCCATNTLTVYTENTLNAA